MSHYRDRFGLECDNVIHFSNGKYALIEVKLRDNGVIEAEKNLLRLQKLILENPNMKKPEFLMVVTGSEIAYTTNNDVLVIQIGC